MIFTTHKNPKRWGPVLHDDGLADAIVDRISSGADYSTRRALRFAPSTCLNSSPPATIKTSIQAAEFPEPRPQNTEPTSA
jgi:hypothetical protein